MIGPSMSPHATPDPTPAGFGTLVWPRVGRAVGLSLRPARIGLGVIVVLLLALLLRIPSMWISGSDTPASAVSEHGGMAVGAAADHLLAGEVGGFLESLGAILFVLPRELFDRYPGSMGVLLIPFAIVWGIGGAAISRSAATEYAKLRRETWPAMLAFSLSRATSSVLALLAPVVVITLIVLAMAALGWVLMGLSFLRPVGGIFYVVVLAAGALASFLSLLYILGFTLLVPAVACEGTDMIDAIQRSFAYVVARPVRLIAYTLILIVVGVLLGVVASGVAGLINEVAAHASTRLVPAPADQIVADLAAGKKVSAVMYGRTGSGLTFFARCISFWCAVPGILVAGLMVSYYFSASTVLYLLIRQWADGQHPGDLWYPGRVAGVLLPESPDAPTEGDDDGGF